VNRLFWSTVGLALVALAGAASGALLAALALFFVGVVDYVIYLVRGTKLDLVFAFLETGTAAFIGVFLVFSA
jgi:hypothetical protein